MHYRGLTLILFSGSLILSPVAVKLWDEVQDAEPGSIVTHIRTLGSAAADCEAETVETRSYRIGCAARAPGDRRVVAGGAAFVPARR